MTELARRTRWAAGLAALALTAAACSGDGDKDDGDAKAKTFTVANQEPGHLAPGAANDSYGIRVVNALFDRLTRLDKSGMVVNEDAESITSTDQKTWTIKVKPGRTFHNGEPVTAQSYVDAWNAAAYGPNAWDNNYYFGNIAGYDALNPEDPDGDGPQDAPKPKTDKMSGLKVLDRQTFTVKLTDPFSQFPLTLAFTGFAPMPKAATKDLKAFDQRPIGNGPFMISGSGWQHNKQITTQKFAGYRGSRPAHADGLVFKTYASRDAAYTDLLANRVDILETIPPAKVREARRLLGNRFVTTPGGTMDYLEFPLYDKRFQNRDLRYAISRSINRQAIVDAVFNGAFRPTGTIVAPIVPGYRPNACGLICMYDSRPAKKFFEKAGGFSGTLELWFSNADPSYEQWMTDVANQLKQNLGIKNIRFRKVPQADYLSNLTDHKATGPYRANWVMDYPSAENYLTPRCGPSNRQGYDGKECMALIRKGNRAKSIAESVRYYQRAETVLLKDLPVIPLWNWQEQGGYSKNIGNVNFDSYEAGGGVHYDQVTVK
ncbi:MAG TPA: ABC transporter substrate-binding protein [Streptosporangiaceae bacterium]|nr:ABC transporter substrate-binding protein [Streptosporangiaceae bacterium]